MSDDILDNFFRPEETHRESPIEKANQRGACAEVRYPVLFGPTLEITVHNPNQKGPQYVGVRMSYGHRTLVPGDSNWNEKLILFEIITGTPTPGKSSLFHRPQEALLRMEKINEIRETKLKARVKAKADQSISEDHEGFPTRLPSPTELKEVADILRERKDEIGRAFNKIPVDPGEQMVGKAVAGISRGLSEKGLGDQQETELNRVINPPSPEQLIAFIESQADLLIASNS